MKQKIKVIYSDMLINDLNGNKWFKNVNCKCNLKPIKLCTITEQCL